MLRVLVLSLALFAPAVAQDAHPLQGAAGAAPLELATIVDRAGDEAILAALTSQDVTLRVAAIRGSRFLDAPERAVPALVELALSRDPLLAESAGMALAAIAPRIALADRDRDDRAPSEVAAAHDAAARLMADESARADLRRAGALIVEAAR